MTTVAAAFPRLASRGDRASASLELGVEAPIRLGDDRLDRNERRRASLRWLSGAALTGLCGVALIGAALYFDLDSQYDFAEAPEFATAASPSDSQEEGVSPGKGDRLLRPVDIISDKQTYKVPTTIKIGDKEVVKTRAFTRLQTTLTTTPTGFADAVPPFNPLKLTNRADVPDFGARPRAGARRCGSDFSHAGSDAGGRGAGVGRIVADRGAGSGGGDAQGGV